MLKIKSNAGKRELSEMMTRFSIPFRENQLPNYLTAGILF